MSVRKRRSHVGHEENFDRWLLTYADLITLLLAFFVVMYSMSSIDNKKFGQVAEALNGVLKGGESAIPTPGKEVNDDGAGHGVLKIGSLKTIAQKVDEKFAELQKSDLVKAEVTERGLVVHIMESALFGIGSARLEERAVEVLNVIAEIVSPLPNHLRIEGHTDNLPMSTDVYPSNWELSSSRATEVVRFFTSYHGIRPERVSALGYGEYRPLKSNTNAENRAMNRRVDIVVLTMEMTAVEPSSEFYEPVAFGSTGL